MHPSIGDSVASGLVERSPQTGVLRAEPGITLEQILNVAIPRGWMLPVTPGTKYATLGGAIANGPMTYAVNGKQYVATAAGNALFIFGLP